MEARRARMNKLRPIPGGWRLEDSLCRAGENVDSVFGPKESRLQTRSERCLGFRPLRSIWSIEVERTPSRRRTVLSVTPFKWGASHLKPSGTRYTSLL